MKNNITELVFILDRSGSMHGLESDTIGGFNSMLRRQKREPGKAYVTTVLFDTRFDRIHDRVRLEEVPELTARDYVPGGCTALLDALGDTIRHIAGIHRYARPKDVPGKTVFVIMTDGMENASRRYDSDTVKRMIEHEKEKYGWEFLFLAANIDAVETAGHFGIAGDRAVDYRADGTGTHVAYESVSDTLCFARMGMPIQANWSEKIKNDTKKRNK